MLWIVSLIALVGVILNVRRNRWGFALWMVTNAIWAVVDFQTGLYAQAALMAVYWVLAVWGFMSWGQRKRYPRAILALENSKRYWQAKRQKISAQQPFYGAENDLLDYYEERIKELDAAINILRGN